MLGGRAAPGNDEYVESTGSDVDRDTVQLYADGTNGPETGDATRDAGGTGSGGDLPRNSGDGTTHWAVRDAIRAGSDFGSSYSRAYDRGGVAEVSLGARAASCKADSETKEWGST